MKKIMKMGTTLGSLLMVLLLLTSNVGAVAPTTNYDDWSSFAGNTSNNKTIINKPIKDSEDIQEVTDIKGSFSDYIVVDDIVYTIETRKKELQAYNREGKLIKSAQLNDSTGFFARLAYGDNKIFVPLKSSIQAFDINTFKSLWESKKETGQMISSLTYYNGYLYSGITIPKGASTEPSDGFYFGLKTDDEVNKEGIKDYVWKYEEEHNSGFYWAGGTIVNGAVVFVGDNGKVIVHDLVQDKIYDTLDLSEKSGGSMLSKVRANINYNRATNTLIIGTQTNASVVSVKMDGFKFAQSSLKIVPNPAGITGGIATTDDYIFVPSGGMYGSGYTIYDTNLKQIFTEKINTQSYPLVNTNPDGSATSYVINFTNGAIVVNNVKNGAVTSNEIKVDQLKAYNSGGIIANKYGDLIVSNFGGDLVIIKNKNSSYTNDEKDQLTRLIPQTITYDDKELIETINKRIGLSDNILTKLQQTINNKINSVEKIIANLDVDINDNSNIEAINQAYVLLNNLDYEDQQQVKNQEILTTLLKQINAGEEGKKANLLVNKINKLSKNPSLDDEKTINNLYKEYNSYSKTGKELVSNINLLLSKKATVDQLRKIVDKINDDILNLPFELSHKDLKTINKIISDYNKLSKISKKYIEGISYVYDLQKELSSNKTVINKNYHKTNNGKSYITGVGYFQKNNKGVAKHNTDNEKSILTNNDARPTFDHNDYVKKPHSSLFNRLPAVLVGVLVIGASSLLIIRYLKKD